MASAVKNSNAPHEGRNVIAPIDKRFALVVSEWNGAITETLFEGAQATLKQSGVPKENMLRLNVPGSFELSLGAQKMAQRADIDAVICLGCVVQGETRHFDFICSAVAHGITQVALKYDKPVIFGVLTTDTQKQALARVAAGKHGHKGEESATTAMQMLSLAPQQV